MNAIPRSLWPAFVGHMAAYDLDDLPDGAWFAMLNEGAERFIQQHKLRCDAHDAVMQYLEDQAQPET